MVDADGRARAAKVGHRKSRNGCIKCKARRVKCDEVRPTCGNCSRLQMDCVWPLRNPDAAPGHQHHHHHHHRHHSTRSSRPTPSPNPPQYPHPRPQPHPHPPSPSFHSGSTSSTAYHSLDQGQGLAASYMSNWPRWPSEDTPFATGQLDDNQGINLPESKARRLMEHRLMHHWYIFNSSLPHLGSVAPWRSFWVTYLPDLGLAHENVQFGMLATAATHLLRSGKDDDVYAARQSYFLSALHAQREQVAGLCAENAEPVCFGALLITVCSFAMLKERDLSDPQQQPYQPPLEWLQLGRGAGTALWQSVEAIVKESRERAHPALMAIATTYPYFGRDQSYFAPAMRAHFPGVLSPHLPPGDDDTARVDEKEDETREAYEKALSYVGSIQRGIDDGEPLYVLARRIQTFALLAPPRFIGLLALRRPRALVVLAHFWAAVSQVKGVWWLGEADSLAADSTAVREIRAIRDALPKEWMGTMVWPLDQVGLGGDQDVLA